MNDEAIGFLDTYEQYIDAARKGDGNAQMIVGKTLYEYAGSFWYAKNRIEEAVNWLKMAADNGYESAYSYLGQYYSTDRYKNQDYVKAFEYFKREASLGSSDGYYYLGKAYEDGKGVEKDVYESFRYYLKAADLGNVYAMEKVGCGYYEGNIVEEDRDKAFDYLLGSYNTYNKGNRTGRFTYYLARCLLNGEGTDKNPVKAVEVLKEACEGKLLCDQERSLPLFL